MTQGPTGMFKYRMTNALATDLVSELQRADDVFPRLQAYTISNSLPICLFRHSRTDTRPAENPTALYHPRR